MSMMQSKRVLVLRPFSTFLISFGQAFHNLLHAITRACQIPP